MENKSGRRISLNFFDILIIIIVIALTAGLIYVKTRGGSEGQASDAAMVTYEIEIGNLTEDTQNLIHAGDSAVSYTHLVLRGGGSAEDGRTCLH